MIDPNTVALTLFPKLLDTKTSRVVSLAEVFEGIRTGGKFLDTIMAIRTSRDKDARDSLKKTLPLVLFSGKFRERRANALISYSKLICVDFDHLVDITKVKQNLALNRFIYALWRSPSGEGLKALVRVSSDHHSAHALALLKEFPLADAEAIKDVCRATFMSYDPDLYVNPAAEVFTNLVLSRFSDEEKYENLKKWLGGKGEHFVEGNRNSFVAKLSAAANRFGISEAFAKKAIEKDFVTGGDFPLAEAQSVVTKVYKLYAEQHATVSADDVWTTDTIRQVLNVELETADIITVRAVREDLVRDFDEGIPGGVTTYYPGLDAHFRFLKGEQTTITGISGAGKSTALGNLLLVQSVFEGAKVAVLSMETYPPVFYYRELIRTLVGKPIEKSEPGRMTRAEYLRAVDYLESRFFFIYPESASPTPEWTLGRFYEAIIKYGVSYVVVDPHNSQTHEYSKAGGRDDRYLANLLRSNERFALQNNIGFFNVAHPKGIGKTDGGVYREPAADDISGGPVWWQCCDNILVHHRPSLPLDFRDNLCTLRSVKIKKQPMNGVPGVTELHYDWRTGRFYENGYSPLNNFKL